MTDKIVIEGVNRHMDGEWPLDGDFNGRELHIIKRLAGVRAGELQDAFKVGDYDLLLALAVIGLRRAGKPCDEDALYDAPAGKITFVGAKQEDDAAVPPPPASDSTTRTNEPLEPSGETLNGAGDNHRATTPVVTGHQH